MSNICTESVPELVSSFARNRQSYVYKEHLDIVTSYYSALLGVHPVILAWFLFYFVADIAKFALLKILISLCIVC